MRTNPQRRAVLLDAAIDVLADRGARGLTYRAVDDTAGVPPGTASNYFTTRDELLTQASEHLFVRLTPDPDEVAERFAQAHTRELYVTLMHDIVRRATADTRGHLALLELRLEATRRPEVRTAIGAHYRTNLDAIVATHVDEGFPGDRTTAALVYLAMTGLLVEALTLPEILAATGRTIDELVHDIVDTILPS